MSVHSKSVYTIQVVFLISVSKFTEMEVGINTSGVGSVQLSLVVIDEKLYWISHPLTPYR